MLSLLIGSTSEIKAEIDKALPKWNSFESSEKETHVNDVMRGLWGETKPWWDLFGFFSDRSETKVKSVLKEYLAEKKISLLGNLQETLLNSSKISDPALRIFKAAEKVLFSKIEIAPSERPAPQDWSLWKKELAQEVLQNSQILTAPSQASKENVTDLLSLSLHLHFEPELKLILPRPLQERLTEIEQTDAFDRLLEKNINSQIPSASAHLSDMGSDIQQSAEEASSKNKMSTDFSSPILQSILDDNALYLQLNIQNLAGTKIEELTPSTQPKDFAVACSQFTKSPIPGFNTKLQRLVQQYAFTSPMQSLATAVQLTLNSSMIGVDFQNKPVNAAIREKEDGSISIEYTFSGALASADAENQLRKGKIEGSFSYELTADGNIEGPAFGSISYEGNA